MVVVHVSRWWWLGYRQRSSSKTNKKKKTTCSKWWWWIQCNPYLFVLYSIYLIVDYLPSTTPLLVGIENSIHTTLSSFIIIVFTCIVVNNKMRRGWSEVLESEGAPDRECSILLPIHSFIEHYIQFNNNNVNVETYLRRSIFIARDCR
jgi:hypothetical protein